MELPADSTSPHSKPGSSAQESSPEAGFWRWFVGHKDELAQIKIANEPIANELARELRRIDENLTFEIGTGKRELIVSADGIRSAFPAVQRLVKAAPPIPDWTIVAFRQRKPGLSIEMGNGINLTSESIAFQILGTNEMTVDVVLYVRSVAALSDSMKQAVYLLLDSELGEFDVETHVGQIDMRPVAELPSDARPFRELPGVLDALR